MPLHDEELGTIRIKLSNGEIKEHKIDYEKMAVDSNLRFVDLDDKSRCYYPFFNVLWFKFVPTQDSE